MNTLEHVWAEDFAYEHDHDIDMRVSYCIDSNCLAATDPYPADNSKAQIENRESATQVWDDCPSSFNSVLDSGTIIQGK